MKRNSCGVGVDRTVRPLLIDRLALYKSPVPRYNNKYRRMTLRSGVHIDADAASSRRRTRLVRFVRHGYSDDLTAPAIPSSVFGSGNDRRCCPS